VSRGLRNSNKYWLSLEKFRKEDVTYTINGKVVVSDAKSFRLGRSQAAPNVKDAIKRGDYQKWLSAYNAANRLGGLITFPSQHDWKTRSDAYSYVSDASDPIMLIFYEHMAYLTVHADDAKARGGVASILEDYGAVFPQGASKQRADYWSAMIPRFSQLAASDDLTAFMALVQPVVSDAVQWAETRLTARVEAIRHAAQTEVDALNDHELREQLVASIADRKSVNLLRYLKNIRRFRK